MKPKKKKEKKPDYRKTETFQDYKSAAATFSDYNPGTDTVFVGASIDPGMADRKAQHQANVSASKGASKANYNDTKMYRTKNEAGQDVYVSLRKYDKNEYSKGGKMKAKKYKKGGQVDPPKGKKLTKEMVDKQHSSDLDKSANVTNKLAKQAATGMKSNGFPMKKEAVKALAKDVEKRKKRESTSKPNYRDVGKNLPGGASPRFKKGGKFPPKIKAMLKKSKAPKKGGMIDEVTVTAKAPTKTEKAVAKEFSKGLSELKLGFPNTAVQQYYQLESVGNKSRKKGIQSRGDIEGAFESEEKLKKDTRKRAKRGQAFRYKMGGKIKKYLKGGQVKLDANKDGKITGQDFKMLKKK